MGNEGRNAHGRFLASDLQICTVTEDSATVSWVTWDADISPGETPVGMETAGRLEIWPTNTRGEMRTVDSPADSAFHVLTTGGLKPDTDYSFRATSHGTPATYSPATVLAQYGAQGIVHPEEGYRFRTLAKLSGTYLGTIVVANDLHLGETADGNIIAGFPPAAVSAPGAEPYPTVMTESVIDAATRAGASHLFVNGDVTSENRPAEVELAERLFKAFPGALRTTRGNHDRPHRFSSGAEYAAAPPLAGKDSPGEYSDAFGSAFEPRQKMWVEHIPYGDLRVIGIDSTHMDAAGGTIEPQQFTDIEKELASRPNQPTIILLHHPMTRDAAWSHVGGPAFILNDADMLRLQRLIAEAPGVRLVCSGHTHRARRDTPDLPTRATYLETPSAKNWPTGATHLRIHTDGIYVNFRHAMGDAAFEWARRTRWTYFGLAPLLGLGPVEARNLVVRW
ncbi:hypothetical protein CWC39_04830 [Corynebacterium heidelbergense]|uniref:Fibronectin type-III domain-containing protein n=1 Tax=Corynebacterium heidelbergense TaxID=2055947 RepID=A0A364VC48_9CORY|nr:hypothetical protein CWC39_04830 [Corynebacterium heidelbergense]